MSPMLGTVHPTLRWFSTKSTPRKPGIDTSLSMTSAHVSPTRHRHREQGLAAEKVTICRSLLRKNRLSALRMDSSSSMIKTLPALDREESDWIWVVLSMPTSRFAISNCDVTGSVEAVAIVSMAMVLSHIG
jgi:hypothetical protein